MLKLKLGRQYRRKDGKITGPLQRNQGNTNKVYPFWDPVTTTSYTADGLFNYDYNLGHSNDLVSEWADPNLPDLTSDSQVIWA